MRKINRRKKQEMYLDWVNNFLTVEAFAEHYGITIESAEKIIKDGKEVNERQKGVGI